MAAFGGGCVTGALILRLFRCGFGQSRLFPLKSFLGFQLRRVCFRFLDERIDALADVLGYAPPESLHVSHGLFQPGGIAGGSVWEHKRAESQHQLETISYILISTTNLVPTFAFIFFNSSVHSFQHQTPLQSSSLAGLAYSPPCIPNLSSPRPSLVLLQPPPSRSVNSVVSAVSAVSVVSVVAVVSEVSLVAVVARASSVKADAETSSSPLLVALQRLATWYVRSQTCQRIKSNNFRELSLGPPPQPDSRKRLARMLSPLKVSPTLPQWAQTPFPVALMRGPRNSSRTRSTPWPKSAPIRSL